MIKQVTYFAEPGRRLSDELEFGNKPYSTKEKMSFKMILDFYCKNLYSVRGYFYSSSDSRSMQSKNLPPSAIPKQ